MALGQSHNRDGGGWRATNGRGREKKQFLKREKNEKLFSRRKKKCYCRVNEQLFAPPPPFLRLFLHISFAAVVAAVAAAAAFPITIKRWLFIGVLSAIWRNNAYACYIVRHSCREL